MAKIDNVQYYTGKLRPFPSVCVEPLADEVGMFLDLTSNWMKFFEMINQLSDEQLMKALTVELRGRRRAQMLDRIRAAINNRRLQREKREINTAVENIPE